MKALTERQASACENATRPRCRCRCGGALHGAARGVPLHELPKDDPHHAVPTPAELQTELELEAADVLERLEGAAPVPPDSWGW